MYRYLTLLCVLLISVFPTVFATESKPMIELHARCIDDPLCRFRDQELELELEVFNAGREAVSLPTEYYQRRGPVIKLVDNRSGKRSTVGMGQPMPQLLDQLQVIEPGQSYRFRWIIMPEDIQSFALRPVDLTVEFGLSLNPRLAGADAKMITTRLHVAADPAAL